ncbi:MAG: T9SS type A sorting domain-containing protein [Bacteroidales bacterium]|nr:T9SS type A sorting domain-containing protein [Bacteroidales bacterium]
MKLSHYLLVVSLLLSSFSLHAQYSKMDSLALTAFFRAANGPGWYSKTNWLSPTLQINTWYGVSVSTSSKLVYQLLLPNNNLTGYITDSIADLTGMKTIDLSGNKLSGNLPDLSTLNYLSKLDVSHNLYTFTDLDSSKLNDSSIDNFTYAPQDTVLGLKSDPIAGTISVLIDESPFNDYKWYIDNDPIADSTSTIFTKAEGWYKCEVSNTKFTELTLYSDSINLIYSDDTDSLALVALYESTNGNGWTNKTGWKTGKLATWHGITLDGNGRVTAIDLASNNLTGSLPRELANLSKLEMLKINDNKISGSLPFFQQIETLTTLWVQDNLFHFADLLTSGIVDGDITSLVYHPQKIALELFYDIPKSLLTVPDKANQTNEYSWYRDGSLLENDTTRTIGAYLGGDYYCVATNSAYPLLDFKTDTVTVQLSMTTDSLALVSLYQATGGESWTKKDNWLTTGQPVSSWYGVSVANGRVTKILLPRNNLKGEIPAQISSLSKLTDINLNNNDLTGTIPAQIDMLTQIKSLKLFNNRLSGIIPAGIDNLDSLTTLELYSNQLTGEIPAGIVSLQKLISLRLSDNELTGVIPSGIGSLTGLKWLELSNNGLTGTIPSEIGDLSALTSLKLDNNGFSGAIPAELGNLTGLMYLYLNNNDLSGVIPSGLGNLSHLTQLSLSGNMLTGSIPSSLFGLTSLSSLLLADNELNGQIPAQIGSLTSLTALDLSKNKFSKALPSALSSLTNLNSLKLDSNMFSGNLPTLSAATKLKQLSLENNLFSFSNLKTSNVDTILTSVFTYAPQDTVWSLKYIPSESSLRVLEDGAAGNFFKWYRDNTLLSVPSDDTLRLTFEGEYYCQVINPNFPDLTISSMPFNYSFSLYTDSLALVELYNNTDGKNWTNNANWCDTVPPLAPLSEWAGVTVNGNRVVKLVLTNNKLTGALPVEIGTLTQLTELSLHSNALSGNIPEEIGEIDSLRTLNLSNNLLDGPIPATIGQLSKLNSLSINSNQLEALPEEIGNLTNLNYLALNSNQLSGVLPASIGNLVNLKTLKLGSNQFSGALPADIGNLTSLLDLSLEFNDFSGNLPGTLGDLLDLTSLTLNDNDFEGTLPEELSDLDYLTTLNVSGNHFSGSISEDFSYLSNLNNFNISNNLYFFIDIEPVIDWCTDCGLVYSPQSKIGKENALVPGYIGQPVMLEAEGYVVAEADEFTWFKNGVIINGETDSVLIIDSFNPANEGQYHCVVSNVNVAGLLLESYPITLTEYSVPVDQVVANLSLASSADTCFNALQSITVAGSKAVTLYSGSSATFIAGQSVRFLPGFHARAGSNAHAYITEDESFCEPEIPMAVYAALALKSAQGIEEAVDNADGDNAMDMRVFPNPNNGSFTVRLPEGLSVQASVNVIDMQGRVVYSARGIGEPTFDISLPNVQKGIYFVRVIDQETQLSKKVIVL